MIRLVSKFLDRLFRSPEPPPPPMPIVIPVPAKCRVRPGPKPCAYPRLSGSTAYAKGCRCARCRRESAARTRKLYARRKALVAGWKPGDGCCFPKATPKWSRTYGCPCPRCVAPEATS